MKRALSLSAIVLGACGGAAPDLGGTWRTGCLPQVNGGMTSYSTSEISDAGATPRFTVTTYADARCETRLFALGNQASRSVGAEIPGVPGAYELDVTFRKLVATAYTAESAATLSAAGCGAGPLAIGEEKDVSATGCLFFRPLAQCARDYDIVKVEGDRLYNGVRGGDQCVPAGRPRALNAFSFDRVR